MLMNLPNILTFSRIVAIPIMVCLLLFVAGLIAPRILAPLVSALGVALRFTAILFTMVMMLLVFYLLLDMGERLST